LTGGSFCYLLENGPANSVIREAVAGFVFVIKAVKVRCSRSICGWQGKIQASSLIIGRWLLCCRASTGVYKMDKTSSTTDLLATAINAEALRQKAIANNIANLQTPGYRRVDVKFEELLAKAMDSPGNVDVSKVEPVVHQPGNTPVKANGNDVNLEIEVGQMVETKST
jgi:flagellar basal-body rod protein FlgB